MAQHQEQKQHKNLSCYFLNIKSEDKPVWNVDKVTKLR